jgi:RNA-binding protein
MNKQQILFLRKKAQTLKSKFQIGKNQLNGTTLINLRNGLRVHELIKIHILKSAQQEDRAFILDLASQLSATIIQEIGHQLVLYKPNPQQRKIILPA